MLPARPATCLPWDRDLMFSQLGHLVVMVEHGSIRQVSFKGEFSQCFGVFADRSTAVESSALTSPSSRRNGQRHVCENMQDSGRAICCPLVAQTVKRLPTISEAQVQIPGSGRSPGGGNGNRLQYSCLENPMDRGAWWATVHGVAKSRTRLSAFTLLSSERVFPFLPQTESCMPMGKAFHFCQIKTKTQKES